MVRSISRSVPVLSLARWQVELIGATNLQLFADCPEWTDASFDASVAGRLEVGEAARALADETGTSVPAVLAAAFSVLVARYGGSRKFLMATAGVARGSATLLPSRIEVEDTATFADLVRRTQRSADRVARLAASVSATAEALRSLRDGAVAARCSVAFVAAEGEPPEDMADLELLLSVGDASSDAPTVVIHYASSRHHHATVSRLVEEFTTVCGDLLDHSDRAVGLADQHGQRLAELLAQGRGERVPLSRPLHHIVAEHAAAYPEATAVVSGGRRLSYAELDAGAARLAERLEVAGVRPGDLVIVAVDRTEALPLALLAVLAAGAAYLPVDLELPEARLDAMLAVAEPTAVIATGNGLSVARRLSLPVVTVAAAEGEPPPRRHWHGNPDDVAYVMFTSGSTGEPKGVAVTHRGVDTLAREPRYVDVGPADVVAGLAPEFFGAATLEIWLALLNGATLALAPSVRMSPSGVAGFVRDNGVTVAHLTAGLLRVVADERPDAVTGIRHLLTGGDVVAAGHVARIVAAVPGIRVSACYGSTETAVLATVAEVTDVDPGGLVPIGHAIAGREAHIVTDDFRLASDGVRGELAVGGDCLARGYYRRPGLTAERFVPHPYEPGARLYRTGDLGRSRAGETEFLGRNDQQVKIRGFRVEPLEVERALGEHPAVSECVVRPRSTVDGRVLVAYVVLDREVATEGLREFLGTRLPEYCVPSRMVILDGLPLTKRAKVDGAALDALPVDDGCAPPEQAELTATEELVRRVWARALGGRDVRLDADFFMLGGHSLSALRAVAQLARELDREVPVSMLFATPTVRAMAAALDQEE